MRHWILALALILPATTHAADPAPNPPAEGFDVEGSDPAAIAIADEVVEAVGGRAAWDRTRHIRWRFLGGRLHSWDKHTGRVRIEGETREGEPFVLLTDLDDLASGEAWVDGEKVVEEAAHAEWMDRAEAMWINDGYWMFLPWKLKDSGVTLRDGGEDALPDGRAARVLELDFEDVGRTPENRYRVFVGNDTKLIEWWEYFPDDDATEPALATAWSGWAPYGDILLADSRRELGDMSEIAVFDALPDSVYTDPAPVDWDALEP